MSEKDFNFNAITRFQAYRNRGENRGSLWRSSLKKGVLEIFTKFTGKYLWQSLRPANLLKERLWHRCFPREFSEIFKNTSGQLLLEVWKFSSVFPFLKKKLTFEISHWDMFCKKVFWGVFVPGKLRCSG